MRIFGLWITTEKTYQRYLELANVESKCAAVKRWFAWPDLDIIFDYIYNPSYFDGVERARREYAKKRGTDEYGNNLNDNA